MVTLQELHSLFATFPAAILGGGPSLPSDLWKLPGYTVLIGVNQHAMTFCRPDVIVYMDKLSDCPELVAALKGYTGIRISQIRSQSDVDLTGVPYWDGGMSSSLATWLACYLDCNPVLLCGMDCYQGEQKYCDGYELDHPCVNYPLENHLKAWKPALTKCPNPERIRAVSGPLAGIFGQYEYISPAR